VQRDGSLGSRLSDSLPYLLAEVAHAVEREMAASLSDVLVRRTHVAFETRDNGRAAARRIAPLMGTLLRWSEHETAQQLVAYDRDVARLFTIDDV
jgi:glycerol-3-phosphate dehydrogenase